MKVGIVGGGIMGVCLGYFLAKEGATVEIYEASSQLGGLARPITLEDGTLVDRFYHTILPSDGHLRQLCGELNIADRLRFNTTRTGFYHRDKIYSMNGLKDFMRFPPLKLLDRIRLGLTVLYAQMVRDWRELEGVSVEAWLTRLNGRRTYENIWRPMLQAKFPGNYDQLPATYIWSRIIRMKSARSGAEQRERASYLVHGYLTLLHSMEAEIVARGGVIHRNNPVQEILLERGRAWGLRRKNQATMADAIVAALPVPVFRHLIPDADPDYRDFLSRTRYLGIIAPLLVLDRPLSGYWTLYITDDQIPFTGIIETTAYIHPEDVGGHHLVYLPKYTSPGGLWQNKPDEEIKAIWLEHLEKMFPEFDRQWIREFMVHREHYVEPLQRLNAADFIPSTRTPIENLYLATTAQIYPQLNNGESVSQHARHVAEIILAEQKGSTFWTSKLPKQLLREGHVPASVVVRTSEG